MDQIFFMSLPCQDYAVIFFAVVFFNIVQSKNETARQNGRIFLWVK
jgi:hypothetical protein